MLNPEEPVTRVHVAAAVNGVVANTPSSVVPSLHVTVIRAWLPIPPGSPYRK
jgi:hypothetical protein